MRCEPRFCPFPCDPGERSRHSGDMADICTQPASDFRLSFPADPYSVRVALRASIARFRRCMTEEEAGSLEIVLGEALNNIVEHAYEDRHSGTVVLRISAGANGLRCRLLDRGRTLPGGVLPAGKVPELAVDGPPEALPEGGFGWFLIHDLTRDLTYAHANGLNQLEFLLPLRGTA